MKHIWNCRRTGIAFVGMLILGIALFIGKVDTSASIAAICMTLAGANAAENAITGKKEK